MMTRELIRNFELLASVVVVAAAAKQDGGLVKQGLSNWNWGLGWLQLNIDDDNYVGFILVIMT